MLELEIRVGVRFGGWRRGAGLGRRDGEGEGVVLSRRERGGEGAIGWWIEAEHPPEGFQSFLGPP